MSDLANAALSTTVPPVLIADRGCIKEKYLFQKPYPCEEGAVSIRSEKAGLAR